MDWTVKWLEVNEFKRKINLSLEEKNLGWMNEIRINGDFVADLIP